MKLAKNQLTARQQKFCQHYVGEARHNSALAARMAGYAVGSSHVTGCQLLRGNLKIAAAIRGLEDAAAKELRVTRQGVMRSLLEAVDTARSKQNPLAMVSGLKELARMAGLYVPEVKSIQSNTATANALKKFSQMEDHELVALMARNAA